MEKLIFDSGIKEYELGSGILRFNPSDPNVYARFTDAIPAVRKIEDDLVEKGKSVGNDDAEAVLNLMRDADTAVKAELNSVFVGNDFDSLLEGVNLLALARNGERVITNLMNALTPIVESGVKSFADHIIADAKANREQRRAAQRDQK